MEELRSNAHVFIIKEFSSFCTVSRWESLHPEPSAILEEMQQTVIGFKNTT